MPYGMAKFWKCRNYSRPTVIDGFNLTLIDFSVTCDLVAIEEVERNLNLKYFCTICSCRRRRHFLVIFFAPSFLPKFRTAEEKRLRFWIFPSALRFFAKVRIAKPLMWSSKVLKMSRTSHNFYRARVISIISCVFHAIRWQTFQGQ